MNLKKSKHSDKHSVTPFTSMYFNTGAVEISKFENDSSVAKQLKLVTSVFKTLNVSNKSRTKMFLVFKTLNFSNSSAKMF